MKKSIILIFALFFISLSLAFAGFPYDTVIDGVAYTANETFDTLASSLINWTNGSSDVTQPNFCNVTNGMLSCSGLQGAYYKHQLIQVATNSINYTIGHFNISVKDCSGAGDEFVVITSRGNFTTDADSSIAIRPSDATTLTITDSQAGGPLTINDWKADGTTQDVQLVVTTTSVIVIVNGTTKQTKTFSAGFEPDFFGFGNRGSGVNVCAMNISGWVSYNGSIYNRSTPAPETPPDSAFNLGNYSREYAATGYKLSNFTSHYDARTDRFGNFNFTALLNLFIPSFFNLQNYSAEYANSGYKNANFTSQFQTEVPLCSGTDKITSSDGNTLTCASDQTSFRFTHTFVATQDGAGFLCSNCPAAGTEFFPIVLTNMTGITQGRVVAFCDVACNANTVVEIINDVGNTIVLSVSGPNAADVAEAGAWTSVSLTGDIQLKTRIKGTGAVAEDYRITNVYVEFK